MNEKDIENAEGASLGYFEEVNKMYTCREAIDEAKRCLRCKVPQCRKGCPIENNIPDFIHELSKGNMGEAMAVLHEKTNLPAICGRVCPHEKQCEGHCVLGKKGPYAWVSSKVSLPVSTTICNSRTSEFPKRRVARWP